MLVRPSVLAAAAVAIMAAPAFGQTPPANPLAASPVYRAPILTPTAPADTLAPRSQGKVSLTGIQLDGNEVGEVPAIPVKVTSIQIEGGSGLTFLAELEALKPSPGGGMVKLTDLAAARTKMLTAIRNRGYPLTTVSLSVDQRTGVATYTIVMAHIVEVKIDGDRAKLGSAADMVLNFLNRLIGVPELNSAILEQYLLLAQDVPGVSVSAVLERANDWQPGALRLIASVSRHPYTAQILADNRAFNETGPYDVLAVFDVAGLTGYGDKTEVSLFHAFPNSQNFGQISTEWYIYNKALPWMDGLRARIYGGAGTSDPTGSLGSLGYHGVTNIFGGQLSYPVIRSRQQNLTINLAFDATESTVDTAAGGVLTQGSADEVRSIRIGGDYLRADNLLGQLLDWTQSRRNQPGEAPATGGAAEQKPNYQLPATNTLTVRLSHGLDILGGFHGAAQVPSTARANEQHDYLAVKFTAVRTQTLYVPWEGASVAVMGLLTGQYSPNVLPPSEQFYLGGAQFTRGFYSGQVPGDKALAATIELQFNTVVDLSWAGVRADTASQFYLFYDWGETWQNQSIDLGGRLASAGGGVRLQITPNYELDLEALGRMTRRPPPLTSDLNGIGLYWRVVGRF